MLGLLGRCIRLLAVLRAHVPIPMPDASAYVAVLPARMYSRERHTVSVSLGGDPRIGPPAGGACHLDLQMVHSYTPGEFMGMEANYAYV